jgi:hypothetical protein
LGPLCLEYLLAVDGAGYFRQNVVRKHIQEGRLHRVADALEFLYLAYAIYAADADMAVLAPALAGLRQAAPPRIVASSPLHWHPCEYFAPAAQGFPARGPSGQFHAGRRAAPYYPGRPERHDA